MWDERVLRVVKSRFVIRELVCACILVETRMTNAATIFSMRFFYLRDFLYVTRFISQLNKA